MTRFLLGVNYWPRSGPAALWSQFDLGEIDDDFAHVAALGFDVVRFFLPWATFAPTPDGTSQEALDRFEILLDRLDAHKLRALPALFCGHACCADELPAWARDPAGGAADFYTGDLLEAQRVLARAAGERGREHSALLVWDIGNEFTQLRRPRSPHDAAHWSAALTHDLFASSNVAATGGLCASDITQDRGVRPSSVAEPWAFASMQGSSISSGFARNKLDSQVAPFLCEATASFARKPVLFTAFGNPTCPPGSAPAATCLSEEEMAVYARKALDRLQHRGALGALWWCWSDYAEPGAESTFGILRADGSEKPVARALSAFSAEQRPLVALPPPFLDEREHYAGMPGSVERAYTAYLEEHDATEEIS